jgi:hypothetical protein
MGGGGEMRVRAGLGEGWGSLWERAGVGEGEGGGGTPASDKIVV